MVTTRYWPALLELPHLWELDDKQNDNVTGPHAEAPALTHRYTGVGALTMAPRSRQG